MRHTCYPCCHTAVVTLLFMLWMQSVVTSSQYNSQIAPELIRVFLKVLEDGEPQFIAEPAAQVRNVVTCRRIKLVFPLFIIYSTRVQDSLFVEFSVCGWLKCLVFEEQTLG